MDSIGRMLRGGLLHDEECKDLIELARDGLVEHRLARWMNALVLLDPGMSCQEFGRDLLLEDDTTNRRHKEFLRYGVDGLAGLHCGGRAGYLSVLQEMKRYA